MNDEAPRILINVCHIQINGHCIELTPDEVEVLASLAEMTDEAAPVTFGDWLKTNNDKAHVIESVSEKLDMLYEATRKCR